MSRHREEHDEIRKGMAALRALLIDHGMPVGHWGATVRWSLDRRLLRHITAENLDAAPPGDAFERRYRAHLSAWTPHRIDSEWRGYCRATNGLLDDLEARMIREEAYATFAADGLAAIAV